jgi:hypothetical protein
MKADKDVTIVVTKPIKKAAKVLTPTPMAKAIPANGKINKPISSYLH